MANKSRYFNDPIPQLYIPTSTASAENQQGMFGNIIDSAQAGALSAIGGIFDFVGADGIAKQFYGWSDNQYEQMSDAGREAMGRQFFEEDEEGNLKIGEGLTSLDTWLLTMANVAGQFAGTAIPGAGAASAAAKAASLGSKGKAAANIVGMGATGGAAATGQGMEQAREEVRNMPDKLLAKSDIFRDIYLGIDGAKPDWSEEQKWDAAKDALAAQVAREVQTDPVALAANFGASAIGDPLIGRALTGARLAKNGAFRSAVRGALIEGSTEAVQAGTQQYSINQALQPIDGRDDMDGVRLAAINEGLAGAGFGGVAGGFGGVANRQPKDQPAQAQETGSPIAPASAPAVNPDPSMQLPPEMEAELNRGVDPAVAAVAEQNPTLGAELNALDQASASRQRDVAQALNRQRDLDMPTAARNAGFANSPQDVGRFGDMLTSPVQRSIAELDEMRARTVADMVAMATQDKSPTPQDRFSPVQYQFEGEVLPVDRQQSAGALPGATIPGEQARFIPDRRIEGEYQQPIRTTPRPQGITDKGIIFGQDNRPEQQAQERADNLQRETQRFADNARSNYQPRIPQKDIIFAGNETGVTVKQSGKPFQSPKEALASKSAREAKKAGNQIEAVPFADGYGWQVVAPIETNQAVTDPNIAALNSVQDRPDGKTETVDEKGLTLLHGSTKSDLTLSDIQIIRSGQKQAKKGRTYGGFYATSESDIEQAKGYSKMGQGEPTIYDINVKPGTKVLQKEGDITRLSESYINELTDQGYGLVIGKDPRGRTEYVVIDKNAISYVKPRVPTDTNVGTTLSDQAAVTLSPETDTAPQAVQARPAPEPVNNAEPAADLAGAPIDQEWAAFADETGTKKIPRAEMPQIKAEHRGAMVQFMKGRDITHEQDTIPAADLKPTQAEFSPAKVKKAMEFDGGNRSILVSSDGYVLDGHHQWLAAREKGEAVDVIRLNAPIDTLIPLAREFPSSTLAGGAVETESVSNASQAEQSAPKTLRDRKEAARKSKSKESPAAIRASNIIGAKVGDRIRIDGAIGYAGNADYQVDQIASDGTVFIKSDKGTTNLNLSELIASQRRGEVKFTKLDAPKTASNVLEAKPTLKDRKEAARSSENAAAMPEVLTLSKNAYLKKQAQKQKLRESSPGYAQALSKLDEQYDTDYDRALAGLTFEQFNEVNKGVPESLNRQAYAQLREDFGLSSDIKFSKTNNSKDGVVKFDGTEIDKGAFSDAVDRIKQAARYAFSGKVVKNKSDNTEILIPWSGIKKSLSGQVSESALLAATKLDQVIENGVPISVVEDRKGRNNIKAIHNYQTTIEVAGKPVAIQVVVREALDGKRYYDHFEIRKSEGPAPEELAKQDSIQEVSEATNDSIEQAKSDIKFAAANTTGTKPAKGVPVSVAQREADRFVERLSGAAGIKVQILPTQKDAEKLWRMSLDGDFVRGAYSEQTGTVYIIAENARNMTDLKQTIAHELFAHGGLDKVIGADKKQEFLNRLKGTRGKKEFKGLWSQIDRDYDGMSEDVKAEELFAYFVQNQPQQGPVKFWWNAFKRWLNNILANLGITNKGDPDIDRMQRMMESIMFGFQFGRQADSNADGGLAFSRTKAESDNQDSPLSERIKSVIKPRDRFTKSRVPEYEALNAKLRETDKTLTSKIKRELGRWILPGGNMPEVVKQAVRGRDRDVAVHEFDVSMLVGKLEAAMKANGLNADRLTDDQWQKYHSFLTGQSDGSSIAESERLPLLAMREQIDGLTRDYVASVTDKLQRRLEQEGTTDPAELARLEKMMGNIGKYLNRSYKAFDDKKWFAKIPTEVIDNARDYLRNQYQQGGATPEEARAKTEITLNEMVKTGTAYDSLGAFIAESKLGSKDLSVLIPRKDIAPEIRALLGEYIDPRINYAKSVAKMSSMIANDKLLTTIRDIGLGAFIFEKDGRPPEATVQLAGEQSAVYAPLNGLWTTPEIKQAFEDAMGDKPGEGWLEAAIRVNGFIKFGKTVLSPTTAMRNIMSSYFFTVANGHFNQKYMRQAVSAFNAQVKGSVTDGESAYIKRLIKLGVIYDSANAGEMVRAMTDGRVKEMLDGKTGAAFESLRWLTNKATGFYRFGDDFWKIVGFENEKAALVKTGMPEAEAEAMAAERIQDTYPTYSRVGKAGVWLSRFPLVGTFVSFPAEIIRTTGNMVRLAISEMKSDNPKIRAMGARRVVGMSLVSGGIFALSALTRAMFGVSDDEEEALRDLAPEWQKNSTFVYAGRDSKGNLRYFDMTFLDPYGYWKRPIEAFMRNQPVDKALASSLKDMLQPFLGVDITAGKLLEVVSNQKESGGQVYKENDSAMRQAADISKHLALGLAPGAVNNAWRIGMAAADQKRATGQPYSLEDEMLALLGFRSSTFDPKTGLYYRTFDFNSSMAEARQELSGTLRDPNTVSDSDIKAAWERARKKQEKAFKEMTRLTKAAQTGGASRAEVAQILRLAGISQRNTAYLLAGKVPPVNLSDRSYESAVKRAQLIMDADTAREVRERYRRIMVAGVQQ